MGGESLRHTGECVADAMILESLRGVPTLVYPETGSIRSSGRIVLCFGFTKKKAQLEVVL